MEYLPGDFSFMCGSFILEYDYKVVDKMGEIAWNALKNYDPENINSKNYVLKIVNDQLYPGHTGKTYRKSMEILSYIADFGWTEFIKNYDLPSTKS
jgi:hypothetical protein